MKEKRRANGPFLLSCTSFLIAIFFLSLSLSLSLSPYIYTPLSICVFMYLFRSLALSFSLLCFLLPSSFPMFVYPYVLSSPPTFFFLPFSFSFSIQRSQVHKLLAIYFAYHSSHAFFFLSRKSRVASEIRCAKTWKESWGFMQQTSEGPGSYLVGER